MDVVTVEDYRALTNDLSTDDDTVSARLDVALKMCEEELDRWLLLDTYTESVRMHDNGTVYPHAVPITTVSQPSGVSPYMGGYALAAVGSTYWWDPVFGPYEVWLSDPFTTVIYEGGFTRDTFPVGLRLIICDLALALGSRSPVLTSAAVASASVGDVSVSYGPGGTGGGTVDSVLPGSSSRLRRYRRPTA